MLDPQEYPFDPLSGRRRAVPELVAWIEQRFNWTLVNGCERFLDGSGVRHNNRRVASFGEFTPYEAWYLDQNNNGFMRWETAPVPENTAAEIVFLLSIGLGNGSALPQPTGRFDLLLNDKPIGVLRVVKHSETWENGPATIHYDVHRLETAPPGQALILDAELREEAFASFGLLFIRAPRNMITPGASARFEVRAFNRARSSQWFKVDKGTNVRFHSNIYPGLEALKRGRTPGKINDLNVYWGDIHSHSGEALDGMGICGTGKVDEIYYYARHVSNLDFYALTEHDWQTSQQHWENLMHKVDVFNDPGRFATIPAFEWTSLVYGHRNVYYPDAAQPFFLSWQEAQVGGRRDGMAPRAPSPIDLWRQLDALQVQALTIPHHPTAASHPFNWRFINPRYDKLVEIYSSWGASDLPHNRFAGPNADHYDHLYVAAALARGLRLGLVASSDSHDGNPGNAQSPDNMHHHLYHYLGSGRTAVLAPELTRDAVFQALNNRRCYAVTGEPLLLDFQLAGHTMGSELKADQIGRWPELNIEVTGTTHLKNVEIIKNGQIIHREPCYEEQYNKASISWVDQNYDARQHNHYFVRVTQQDDEMAWSSPIWVSP